MKSSIFIFLFLACSAIVVKAQDSGKEKELAKRETVKNLVEQQRYVFEAEMFSPLYGRSIHLAGGYEVKITREAITCDLPYAGEIHQPMLNPMDASVRFTSKKFSYNVVNRKRGGWDVTIVTEDVTYAPRLTLSILKNGDATLRFSSNDRQPVSYDGQIINPGN